MTSLTQTLPTVVLDGIISYLEDTTINRERFREIRRYPFWNVVVLLRVCSWWRNAALDRMYRDVWWCNYDRCVGCYSINTNDQLTRGSLVNALETSNIARAKTAKLHWTCLDIMNGRAAKILRSAPFNDLVLANITSIELDFKDHLTSGTWTLIDDTTNAQTFCTELNRMFPNAHGCAVQNFMFFGWHANRPFVQCLTAGLFAPPTASSPYGNSRSLSRLVLDRVTIESSAVEIICRSASTLRDIAISSHQPQAFTSVVITGNGTPIVYPQVHTVDMSFSLRMGEENSLTFDSPDGTPFPSLRKLILSDIYPFSNDVMFRGNHSNLQHLCIGMSQQTIASLGPYGVFNAGYFEDLRYIRAIASSHGSLHGSFEEIMSLLKTGIRVSTIKSHWLPISGNAQILLDDGFGRNVTLFEIPNMHLTIRQILKLIHDLPRLKRMAVTITDTDELRIRKRRVGRIRGMWQSITSPLRDFSALGGSDDIRRFDLDDDPRCPLKIIQKFISENLDLLYTDMDFMDELYAHYYPLSTTLLHFDGYTHSHTATEMASRVAIIMMALCPTVQRFRVFWESTWLISDLEDTNDTHVDRRKLEETPDHIKLLERLQRVKYSAP